MIPCSELQYWREMRQMNLPDKYEQYGMDILYRAEIDECMRIKNKY